jgi:transposase
MRKMSERQWKLLDVVQRVAKEELSVAGGADATGLTERWIRGLVGAFEERGDLALVHGNTGRSPANKLSAEVIDRVVKLRRTTYDGFNDHHFHEKLTEKEGVVISRPSVQRVLREAGIGAVQSRRSAKHRQRRDRKPQAGTMILWDGSPHDWLEGRGPRLCLMGAVDDATSELLPGAHFLDQECAAGYLRVMRDLVAEKGIPLSAYMDKHGALRRNDSHWTLEEELRGVQEPTQVERALTALGVEIIYAHSPQAKGRVERGWSTHQDRLISELRLAKATSAVEANKVLDWYRPDHNRRFAIAPQNSVPAWRSLPVDLDLDRVCAFLYDATVGNDNAVRIGGLVIDIPPGPGNRGYAKARVEVRQLLDGSWRVEYQGKLLATVRAARAPSNEIHPLKRRKRSAAARAFRRGVAAISASLP